MGQFSCFLRDRSSEQCSHVQNNARMYIYDRELQQRTDALHFDGETVQFIADKLKQHNSLLVEIDDSDCGNMSAYFF